MKNLISFSIDWIGGDRFHIAWKNNLTGSSGSFPAPVKCEDVSKTLHGIVKSETGTTPLQDKP